MGSRTLMSIDVAGAPVPLSLETNGERSRIGTRKRSLSA